MRLIAFIVFTLLISSCASDKKTFNKYKTCSNESLKYLKNPRNQDKVHLKSPELVKELAKTRVGIQQCYEDFGSRSDYKEFSTCMVVGVDKEGGLDFYNFGSREVGLDNKFIDCAKAVTKSISFSKYGKNYILIQSYQFFVTGL
jgi:hypothetical protein